MDHESDTSKQIQLEIKTMRKMILIYCKGNHPNDGTRGKKDLCEHCEDLFNYTLERIEGCPIKESKTFCSTCQVHCYKPDRREEIRTVMRYSGPRMIFHDPIMAIRHLRDTQKQKRKA